MVKMYFLAVLRKEAPKSVILSCSYDLSEFGFFHKKGAKEFMRFSSITLVGRTEPDVKVSVKERKYICSAFVQQNNLAAAAITDDEYPTNVVHICLERLLSDFTAKIHRRVWAHSMDPIDEYECIIEEMREKFADPKDADMLSAIRNEIEETRVVLHHAIENVLQRGEKLDDLVSKADELSLQTKAFYQTARKTNACCGI